MATGKDDYYCPQCDHCNRHRAVTGRVDTWVTARDLIRSSNFPNSEDGSTAYTPENVFALALLLELGAASDD